MRDLARQPAPLFRYLLLSRGMDLEDLRRVIGLSSRSHFSTIINGKGRMGPKFVRAMEAFFDLPIEHLMRRVKTRVAVTDWGAGFLMAWAPGEENEEWLVPKNFPVIPNDGADIRKEFAEPQR